MIKSIHREAMLEMLLNTVETERHVRGALLLEVIDEVSSRYPDGGVTRAARALFDRVQRREITDTEFIGHVAELRALCRRAAAAAASAWTRPSEPPRVVA